MREVTCEMISGPAIMDRPFYFVFKSRVYFKAFASKQHIHGLLRRYTARFVEKLSRRERIKRRFKLSFYLIICDNSLVLTRRSYKNVNLIKLAQHFAH